MSWAAAPVSATAPRTAKCLRKPNTKTLRASPIEPDFGALYDEHTIFPDGADIYDGWPWGLDSWISPWNAGMIPAPEPAGNTMTLAGVAGLAGLARVHARRRARVAGLA